MVPYTAHFIVDTDTDHQRLILPSVHNKEHTRGRYHGERGREDQWSGLARRAVGGWRLAVGDMELRCWWLVSAWRKDIHRHR